jgi:hypothetical protein
MTLQEKLERLILSNVDKDSMIFFLSRQKPIDLAMLKAKGSPGVKMVLESDELTPLWENKFNALRLKSHPNFQFRDPKPQSKADFYCGYVLFLAALNEDTASDEYRSYLKLSISAFNSFHAHQELISRLIIDCRGKPTPENINKLVIYINGQKAELQKLKTPGCLLLAHTYLQIASLYGTSDRNLSRKFYRDCWENLHLAELCEERSENEIENAYFNQGLKFASPFRLNNINEMKAELIKTIQGDLPGSVRLLCEAEAVSIFSENFKKSEELEEEETLLTSMQV